MRCIKQNSFLKIIRANNITFYRTKHFGSKTFLPALNGFLKNFRQPVLISKAFFCLIHLAIDVEIKTGHRPVEVSEKI